MRDYQVIDLENKEKVPSIRDGYRIYFTAKDLPSLGYKKYGLVPVNIDQQEKSAGLPVSSTSIENQYYKIITDNSSKVISIVDKKSGKELVDSQSRFGFNAPLVKKFPDTDYNQIDYKNVFISIKDESPVRVILRIERPGELFEKTEYVLWNDVDRIDVEHVIYPERLDSTDKLEQYSIGFPFNIPEKQVLVETSGGFFNPDKDKLPGTSSDVFSIRRTAVVYNSEQSMILSSIDARVIELRDNIILSNTLNNFPLEWNRYEENVEKLSFKYSFSSQQGSFNTSYASKFGWEFNTPPVIRRSWYTEEPTSKSYLSISNDEVLLLALPSENEESFYVRLVNNNRDKFNEAVITSELFTGYNAFLVNYLEEDIVPLEVTGNSIFVNFRPNEIKTIKLTNRPFNNKY
jgi:hypothetical protein